MRQCTRCQTDKLESEFYPNGVRLSSWCRSCHLLKAQEWAKNNPEKRRARDLKKAERYKLLPSATQATCHKCHCTKLASEFSLARSRSTGLHAFCKVCSRQKGMERRRADPARSNWLSTRSWDKRHAYTTCSIEEWRRIMALPCQYCGHAPVTGADRIDNAKGHEQFNLLPCCHECNIARGAFWTVEEMQRFIGPAIREIRAYRALLSK